MTFFLSNAWYFSVPFHLIFTLLSRDTSRDKKGNEKEKLLKISVVRKCNVILKNFKNKDFKFLRKKIDIDI